MRLMIIKPLFIMVLLTLTSTPGFSYTPLEDWLLKQKKSSLTFLLQNVSPPGAVPGAIVASPSKEHPNYYFHWVRDAALAVQALLTEYSGSATEAEKENYYKILMDYVQFSQKIQDSAQRISNLGEPKFYTNGETYTGPWGRPQNDGPALRAISLIHFSNILIEEQKEEVVKNLLFTPTSSVIQRDLDYVAQHWRDSSYDLWEEVRGSHFYTQAMQLKALVDGARLAYRLGDYYLAQFYSQQASELRKELQKYWDPQKQYIVATREYQEGVNYKYSGLDSSIILAIIDSDADEAVFHVYDDKTIATVNALEKAFKDLYPINQRGIPGVAIGRYPEDRYDGYGEGLGNPWVLTTNTFAEYYYLLEKYIHKTGALQITTLNLSFFTELGISSDGFTVGQELKAGEPLFESILQKLKGKGDSYLERIHYHDNPDGSLSEQFHRDTGFMRGAFNLSLSHSSFLSAIDSR